MDFNLRAPNNTELEELKVKMRGCFQVSETQQITYCTAHLICSHIKSGIGLLKYSRQSLIRTNLFCLENLA